MNNKPEPTSLSKSKFEVERELILDAFTSDSLYSTSKSNRIAEEREKEIDLGFENEKLTLENRREKKNVRRRWNMILMILVVVGFIFSYSMILAIGLGLIHFDNNAFAVPSVVAAGVIQTYGLAKLAISYFFSEDGDTKQKDIKS